MRNALCRIAVNTLGGAALGSGFMAWVYASEKKYGTETEPLGDWFAIGGVTSLVGAVIAGAASVVAEVGKFNRWVPWRQRS